MVSLSYPSYGSALWECHNSANPFFDLNFDVKVTIRFQFQHVFFFSTDADAIVTSPTDRGDEGT